MVLEHLAVFDLLCTNKDNLDSKTRNHIKQVAQSLIEAVKAQLKQLENWQNKESTKSQVKNFIYDYLYNEDTGLPVDEYNENYVDNLAKVVYAHVYQQYSSADNHPYAGYLLFKQCSHFYKEYGENPAILIRG